MVLTHGGVSQNKGLLPTIRFYPLSLTIVISSHPPPPRPAIAEVHLAKNNVHSTIQRDSQICAQLNICAEYARTHMPTGPILPRSNQSIVNSCGVQGAYNGWNHATICRYGGIGMVC